MHRIVRNVFLKLKQCIWQISHTTYTGPPEKFLWAIFSMVMKVNGYGIWLERLLSPEEHLLLAMVVNLTSLGTNYNPEMEGTHVGDFLLSLKGVNPLLIWTFQVGSHSLVAIHRLI